MAGLEVAGGLQSPVPGAPVPTLPSSGSSVNLPDELSRRLNIGDPVFYERPGISGVQPRLFCEERHDAGEEAGDARSSDSSLVSKWRQKEKLKTTAVALVLCLNIGVDPPDVVKISPCARLECWVDPLSMQPAKALETIGKNLQAQYERWQPRAKYKMHLDPTLEDVKKLCVSCRRTAKNERVLFHYNGHGVPRPTVNGEIWVFNSRYTQYIPLSMYELQAWLGTPCIYVLDCSAAGFIINSFKTMMDTRQQQLLLQQQAAAAAAASGGGAADPGGALNGGVLGGLPGMGDPMKEVIVLAACGGNELLPQNPDLPADVFTACLTTPIRVALRWFCSRSLLRHEGLTKEVLERIPGRQTDRKTPLGELNWIFTAITDTIAWNCLPRALFQKLFRQDLLVASLFRNFLLAERIMAAANCTPVSYPRLPPTHQHPMWQAWDMAAEMCLLQLPTLLSDSTAEFQPSSFFSEQLTAFELWLQHGSADKKPPEQLPIVLQVLLSQVHRLRALVLLGRFLDMGSWAVDLALSVGIFPYVLKLLQTTSLELRATLVFIWAKILALDRSCQADLVKDNGHLYFLKYLESPELARSDGERAQAAFVLATVCHQHPKGQALCAAAHLPQVLIQCLRGLLHDLQAGGGAAFLAKWLCLCLGKVSQGIPEECATLVREGAHDLLAGLLGAPMPELRAAAVYALGCLISGTPRRADLMSAAGLAAAAAAAQGAGGANGGGGVATAPGSNMAAAVAVEVAAVAAEQNIALLLLQSSVGYDASPLVREELAVALARFVRGHAAYLSDSVAYMQDKIAAQQAKTEQTLARLAARSSSISKSGKDTAAGAGMEDGEASAGGRASAGGAATGGCVGGAGESLGSAGVVGMGSRWPEAEGLDGGFMGSDALQEGSSMALYCNVIELVLMLATDTAPRVAALGKRVLLLAGLDLAPSQSVMWCTPRTAAAPVSAGGSYQATGISPGSGSSGRGGEHQPLGGSLTAGLSAGGSSGVPLTGSIGSSSAPIGGGSGSSVSVSLGSFTSKLVKGAGRNWRSGFTSSGAAGAGAGGGSRTNPPSVSSTPSSSSSPPSPNREPYAVVGYSRPPYVLRTASISQDMGGSSSSIHASHNQQLQYGSSAGDVSAEGRSLGHMVNSSSGSLAGGFAGEELNPGAAGSGAGVLPQSHVYRLSCEYFSRPMLDPQATAWRELEAPELAPWIAPPDIHRKTQRLREMEAARQRCHSVTNPKIREQVLSIETPAEAFASVVFHSFHLLLVSVDTAGMVRVNNGMDGGLLNQFHISNGLAGPDSSNWCSSTAPVRFTRQLNEAESNLLLACAADGGVRVWRNYLTKGAQCMATAWQAVPLKQPPQPSLLPACFALSETPWALYAAGGCHPDVLHRWDLTTEQCSHQLSARSSSSGSSCPVAIEKLSVAQSDPQLVLSSCSDGCLRLYDIRAPSPVATMAIGPTPLAGMVLEPCGQPGSIVIGTEQGDLMFMDIRYTTDAEADGQPSSSSSNAGGGPGSSTDSGSGMPGGGCLSASVVRRVNAHTHTMLTVAAHPNAPLIATGGTHGVVKVWTDAGEAVGSVWQRKEQQTSRAQGSAGAAQGHPKVGAPVTCLAWHPFNLYLGAGGYDSVASVFIVDNM